MNQQVKNLFPAVTADEKVRFIIACENWQNYDKDIYGQRFLADGSALGKNFLITNTSKGLQTDPTIQLYNKKIYSSWEDNRTSGKGLDIWANVLDWDNPEFRPSQLPANIVLLQNYPNPFNSSTIIPFQLANSELVSLKIYDLLGREVNSMLNMPLTAGEHKIIFNGKNCASGVYFYKLQAGDVCRTKKFILQR